MLEWLLEGAIFETLGAWLFVLVFWVIAGLVWLFGAIFKR